MHYRPKKIQPPPTPPKEGSYSLRWKEILAIITLRKHKGATQVIFEMGRTAVFIVLADTQNVLKQIRQIMNHLNEQNKQQTVQETELAKAIQLLWEDQSHQWKKNLTKIFILEWFQ